MATSEDKDRILRILYNADKKYNGVQELGHSILSYEHVLPESGLEDYVFSLAFLEIVDNGYASIVGEDETNTAIVITDKGKYFFDKKGGYFKDEQDQKKKEKSEKLEERLFKSIPILISLIALACSIYNSFEQSESSKIIATQKTKIDSVSSRVDSVLYLSGHGFRIINGKLQRDSLDEKQFPLYRIGVN